MNQGINISQSVEVVGNGLIANKFRHLNSPASMLVFASGVSNSLETDDRAFKRELELVKEKIGTGRLFLYFSSYSVTYKQSKYVEHKLRVEALIRERAEKYLVLRLTNLVGNGGNKNTVINFLIDKIGSGEPFSLYTNAERNFLDIDDVVAIVQELVNEKQVCNDILNIGYPESITMKQVVQIVERYLKKKAVYTEVPAINEQIANDFYQTGFFARDNRSAGEYLEAILKKYFSNQ